MQNQQAVIEKVLARDWFYPYRLPNGTSVNSYVKPEILEIHHTRSEMLRGVVEPLLTQQKMTAVDIGSHQGWYSIQLAQMGCQSVHGIEPRLDHIDDAQLITGLLGFQDQIHYSQGRIEDLTTENTSSADIVLLMGLIYHLENPVAAIRTARALCRKVCIIETQVGPHLSGMMDWGNYEFVRPIKGCFSIIDETDETHGPEASVDGICLAPSAQTLLWLMEKVGFSEVYLVTPPDNAYEQHRHQKRVMAVGFVTE